MRPDMAKVIVERPRRGWHVRGTPKGYRRRLQRFSDDELPRREGIKERWQSGTKSLNEHLGPLRRYLDAQVGRPWDKVFAEICTHINRNSAVQDHVRDHVADYVAVHVLMVGGVPCSGEGDWTHGQGLHLFGWKRWYVCPRSGILQRIKISPRSGRRQRKKEPDLPRFVRVSESLQCRPIAGAWHLVTLKPLPVVRHHCRERDVILDRPVAELSVKMARKHYGDAVYAVEMRRLSKRELRQLPVPDDFWT